MSDATGTLGGAATIDAPIPAEVRDVFRLSSVGPAGRQSGNTNAVFACTSGLVSSTAASPTTSCYLRLTPARHRSAPEVEAEVHWLLELCAGGLPVTEPLPAADGHFVVPYAGGVAVLLRAVSGRPVRRPGATHGAPADFTAPVIAAWAEALARLHNHAAAAAAQSPAAGAHLVGRREWGDDAVLVSALAEAGRRPDAPTELVGQLVLTPALSRALAALRQVLSAEAAWLRSLPRSAISYGATHADLQAANFHIVEGGEGEGGVSVAVFDFDDCCRHFFAHDVAVALTQLRKEGLLHAPVAALGLEDAFLGAYLARRDFSAGAEAAGVPAAAVAAAPAELRTALPRLVRFRAALIMCWAANELREGRLGGSVAEAWVTDSLPVYERMCGGE